MVSIWISKTVPVHKAGTEMSFSTQNIYSILFEVFFNRETVVEKNKTLLIGWIDVLVGLKLLFNIHCIYIAYTLHIHCTIYTESIIRSI